MVCVVLKRASDAVVAGIAILLAVIPAGRQFMVTQAGGSDRWFTDRAEPAIGADLPAARAVLSAGVLMQLLPAEITMDMLNVIDRDAVEYDVVARSNDPACSLLCNHMERWFEHHRSNIDQAALLAFAVAVDPNLFTVTPQSIDLDPIGRIQPAEISIRG